MPKIDVTITISVIVAICAIISPVITAIINNHHQSNLKKMELDEKHIADTVLYKRTIFEKYLQYAGRCIAFSDNSALKDYGEYYFIALLYSPIDLQSDMIKANQLMLEYLWEKATPMFESIIPRMRELIKNP